MTTSIKAQTIVYDGITGMPSFTTTVSTPHSFTGQAFNLSGAAGSTPQISSMQLGRFVVGAQNFAFSRVRVQFWGSFDASATGATQVFSNAIGSPLVFNTGAINTTGNAVSIFTLNFSTPLSFPSTTNLGIGINWLVSADGVTFVDEVNLVTAMRNPSAALPIPVGSNITSGGNTFFRNASNLTNFNFQANDSRILSGGTQATDGLAMRLNAVAVPEPATIALFGIVGISVLCYLWRKRQQNIKAMSGSLRSQFE